jgi:uncharacterized membrane protein
MNKGRLEAFSDGVIAVIITIMVLDLKVPHGADLAALRPVLPVFLSYALSFLYVGIYWSNHHHMLQACHKVNGRILWANLHLLFWMSLIPVVTGWMGENYRAAIPVALYGSVMFLSGIAYLILGRALIALHGADSPLAVALGRDFKGKVSLLLYAIAVAVSFVDAWLALAIYAAVALMWIAPDPRIEKRISA